MESHHIAVVGAGTAGAAAAILLARAGHRVALFERVAVPGPVGAGITLQPTGQAVLARLGLLDPIAARATRVDGLLCRRPDGRAVVDLRYADLDPELYGLGLHRGVLFEALLAAARAEPRIALRCGVAISSTALADGARWLIGDDGARHGPFEIVVAADGSVSELHASAGVPVRARPYPWGALWFVATDRGNTLTADHRVVQVVDGPSRMFGLLPTGRAPRGDDLVVSVFWSIRADRVAAFRARGLAAWRAEAVALDPRSEPILDQITDLDQLTFTQYRDVRMRRWHGERIVFIGDAAHATSPQLGQGANLALWDAMCLADVFADRGEVAAALAAYTALRRRHLNYYQLATRALTPLFQSDSRVIGWLRDLVFPTSRWLPPLRRRMVRTMAGRSSPYGARGPGGTAEKDVTLALARSIARHLVGAQLTRDGDLNLPLGERIERARHGGADVFLSVHASSPGRTARAFVHERGSHRSHALAASLGRQLSGFGGGAIADRGDLAVLAPDRHAPHTAACLLEVDDVADEGGEARLRDPYAVDALGRSIADAIRHFGASFGAATEDPSLAQAIESELRAQLDTERVCAAMIEGADAVPFPASDGDNYSGRAAYGQQPAPPPRPGTLGDLMRAIVLYQPVQLTLRRLGDDAVSRFRLLSPGETALVVTWSAPIAAGVIYGVYRTPELWSSAAAALTWGVNQGIHRFSPDLNVNFSASPSAWSIGLTFDLAPTLRRAGILPQF